MFFVLFCIYFYNTVVLLIFVSFNYVIVVTSVTYCFLLLVRRFSAILADIVIIFIPF